MNIGLIDGDSMVYILAYNHKEHTDVEMMRTAIASFIDDLVILGCIDKMKGVIQQNNSLTFRHITYNVRPYKGTRKESPEYLEYWGPIIKNILVEEHGFSIALSDVETDDVIYSLFLYYKELYPSITIFSPDKDLRMIPAIIYDYKTSQIKTITEEEAHKLFWTLMLTGDAADNVVGIPGTGDKKAEDILKKAETQFDYEVVVRDAYVKHFGGEFYGDLIFQMTKKTLSLLDVRDRFTPDLLTLVDTHRKDNSIFADLPFKV